MISFLDVVKQEEFRKKVSLRLAKETQNETYKIAYDFPLLYRYRVLSKYTLEDILTDSVTTSSIGLFNDLFDGSVYRYVDEKRDKYIDSEWNKFTQLQSKVNLKGLIEENYYKELLKHQTKIENRLSFRRLDFLRTFVCCFSQKNNSTLMWSHYANSNMGICIEYDFNKWNTQMPSRHLLFPIAYSESPIDTNDLVNKVENNKNTDDSLEQAIICSVLNKSKVWSYENEWRLLYVFPGIPEETERISVNIKIKPNAIYFGYHFLKPCFYTKWEYTKSCEEYTEILFILLKFMIKESIKAYIMVPKYGSYDLFAKEIDVMKLYSFVLSNFEEKFKSIRYYYTIHDELMDVLETND